jgi:hypothetical protein
MSIDVGLPPTAADVEGLIVRFDHSTDPREIERIAGQLGASRDHRAVRALLGHLGDDRVQGSPDVEVAVCQALIALDVMWRTGDRSFSLRSRRAMSDDVAETVREFAGSIPWPYFGTRRI